MYPIRTRFQKQIVAEVLPPNGKKEKGVIIFCMGMPSIPKKTAVLHYWAKRGYWTIFPRYRGTWESEGGFLDHEPQQDIFDIIEHLHTPFTSYFDQKQYQIKTDRIFIIGASFGGTVALFSSLHPKVKKVFAFAPVVDWTVKGEKENMDDLLPFMKNGFGMGYRFKDLDWYKFQKGNFFQPKNHIHEFDRKKIFIVMAKDDSIVRPWTVEKFIKEIKCASWMLPMGGHASLSWSKYFPFTYAIKKHFKTP